MVTKAIDYGRWVFSFVENFENFTRNEYEAISTIFKVGNCADTGRPGMFKALKQSDILYNPSRTKSKQSIFRFLCEKVIQNREKLMSLPPKDPLYLNFFEDVLENLLHLAIELNTDCPETDEPSNPRNIIHGEFAKSLDLFDIFLTEENQTTFKTKLTLKTQTFLIKNLDKYTWNLKIMMTQHNKTSLIWDLVDSELRQIFESEN